jgi:hypothetical protein
MSKVKLCWISGGAKGTYIPLIPAGIKCVAEFDSIEQLQSIMRKHLPNNEWVEDMDGNRLDIKIEYAQSR